MFSRTCILLTTVSKNATRSWTCSYCASHNSFSHFVRIKQCKYKCNINLLIRSFIRTSRLLNDEDNSNSKENEKKPIQSSKAKSTSETLQIKELNLEQAAAKHEKVLPKKEASPKILDIITPSLATAIISQKEKKEEKKPEEKPKTILASESLQKLKEKILDMKRDEKDKVTQSPEPAKSTSKKRKRVDLQASSLERNFITPVRAMSDFLLKPSDLESLPKTKRRSPYECEPPITVYWRKDVEAKALEVWGSKENIMKELVKREIERRKYQQNIFTIKRRLKDYRKELRESITQRRHVESGLMGRSGKVVLTAITINASNCLFKFFAWLYTGSHSMFSECIHSLADTINQLILAYGIHKSVQTADPNHPYGYTNMKYVSSLISGVGIFCVGAGLSIYHGIEGLLSPEPLEDFFWAYFILGGSLVSEGATLLVAFNSIRRGAKASRMTIQDYIYRAQDPSTNVVLLEDTAAVLGVIVAASCMGMSTLTHSPIPDALGSLFIGAILGSVASFIIYTNAAALVGRSISQDSLDKINSELEEDVMVRAIHDVKGIDIGNSLVRYKAEIDFDGRELTRAYLDKQDLTMLLEEIKKIENIDHVEEFLLKHGETIVDTLGGEIDRIERKLKEKHPEIRHCDLEIL